MKSNKFVFFKFWLIVASVAVFLLTAICLLPHDTYLRYKSLNIGTYAKAKWVYERVVFDDAPVDIAFIGTSHTLNSVDSHIIEERLNQSVQKKIHVANFSIPHFGRDLHFVLTKFLLEYKRPKLLIVEVRESEARDMHPATHYLSEPMDLLAAPVLVNLRYANNLTHLPLRQFSLFFKTYVPFLFNDDLDFNRSDYLGTHLNYTLSHSGRSRNVTLPLETLISNRERYYKDNKGKLDRSSPLKNFVFFNANKSSLVSLSMQAALHNVKVIFLYLPHYGALDESVDATFHKTLAETVIPPKTMLSKTDIWLDFGHLNAKGAKEMSEWLSKEILKHYDY